MHPNCMLQAGDPKDPQRWLSFGRPVETISTWRLDEVRSLLQLVNQRARQESLTAVGYVSYGACAAFDRAMQVSASKPFPLLWFALFDENNCSDIRPNFESRLSIEPNWKPNLARDEYDTNIARIREHIGRGDTYQVNYSYQLKAAFSGSATDLFCSLNYDNHSRFGAFIDTGRFAICSASPELFFDYQASSRRLISRPMKGTIHRGNTDAEDTANAAWLRTSDKNRAENLMIVDMIRNDMSRLSERSSVHVRDLFALEKYPTLWTMTSTVESTLHPEHDVSDIFAAMFPCASVTGAPKINTMQIIDQIERVPRDIYCGAIGAIHPNGDARFNVAIRTAMVDRELDEARYWVGGGIVWDSEAVSEWQETQTKAKILSLQ